MTTLAELGIRLRKEAPGEHRAPCPQCAQAKPRRADDALAVKLEPDGGATWICHRCGWKGALRPDEDRPVKRRRPTTLAVVKATPPPTTDDVLAVWNRCRSIEPGTVAEHYLSGRRCALPHPEGDLRWHPGCRHPSGHKGPALVALVTDAVTAAPMTLHRTWLAADGSGKAKLDKPRLLKKGHGKRGGVVRLWPDEEVTYGLTVAEGIETALSAAHAYKPVWSCLDAGNLAVLPPLEGIDALTIIADHDEAGLRAADECARRWTADGCEVTVWKSPVEGEDFNDFLQARAA
jgi:putative DNA primase/helicase